MAKIYHYPQASTFEAQWFKAGKYMASGQLKEALEIFENLVSEGYSEAYVEIGNIYECGSDDIPQDLDAARSWYMRAVDEVEDDYAYFCLARLALRDYSDAGTPSDAVDYLRIACKANNPMAQTLLGGLYHEGKVLSKDLDQAIQLHTKAADQGYILPLLYLSRAKMAQGHYLEGLKLRLKCIRDAYRLAIKDRSDPRLWNYLKQNHLTALDALASRIQKGIKDT